VSTSQVQVEDVDSLSKVISTIRQTGPTTRPEVSRVTGLSRTLVTKHVGIALELGFLQQGELGISTGGRAPRLLRFNKDAGILLLAGLGATGMSVGKSDLQGSVSDVVHVEFDIAKGPEKALETVEFAFDKILAHEDHKVWGIGIGLPGPVEFATGLPMSPPIMPGWDKYPVRARLMEKYQVPVWVDNDVNVMALGELAKSNDAKLKELIYIKLGSGIGAGIIIHGRLHRGAQGCAGDIGHIAINEPNEIVCRCGNIGCLEAIAGGWALARDAQIAAENGVSKFLADRIKQGVELTAHDVIDGAVHGDNWCVTALISTGRHVGGILATLVNFHNPSLIVIGGGVSSAGDQLLAAIRETVYRRSLPLATRDLEIRLGDLDDQTGLKGAAEMVLSELFQPNVFKQWAQRGHPTFPINL
jgi:glucokinase-like ROK family protein